MGGTLTGLAIPEFDAGYWDDEKVGQIMNHLLRCVADDEPFNKPFAVGDLEQRGRSRLMWENLVRDMREFMKLHEAIGFCADYDQV